jgi:hypothetical protein
MRDEKLLKCKKRDLDRELEILKKESCQIPVYKDEIKKFQK